ncbi:MAG: hypothetical protein HY916_02545 [Desulfovibrio sp.]|jgi:hypothetical protein|nr:hypothetical protein [Desulfovibrio sp.]
MLANNKGKRLWIADEAGGFVAVKKPADIHNRPRGRGIPDWWVVEKTPDWRPPRDKAGTWGGGSLLSMGLVAEVDDLDVPGAQEGAGAAAPGAGGVKIGAGGKPQGYDAHGRYTGPNGGSVSLLDGSISTFETDGRMSVNGEEADEADDEAPREDADAPHLTDILLADGGRVVSDAGGWDNEARRLEDKQFTPERLVKNAQADIGSDKWAPTIENGETKNHCNEYVASKLRESGAHVPNIGGKAGTFGEDVSDSLYERTGGRIGGQIPSAND